MHSLNEAETLFTYQSEDGRHAFMRVTHDTVVEEIPGFRAATAERRIVDCVFVEAVDAAAAEWVIATGRPAVPVATLLDEREIPYRLPSGVNPAPVALAPVHHLRTDRCDNSARPAA